MCCSCIFVQFIQVEDSRLKPANMNKIAGLLLAILCLSQLGITQNCPGFYTGDLIQSGKVAFMKRAQNNYQYSYEAPISYPIPGRGFQFAATASSIASYNPSYGGFNFQIDGKRKGNTNFIVITLIAGPQNAWNSFQVSYLVSSRDDMAVGKYTSNQWQVKGSGDTIDYIYTIPKSLPPANYRVAAFISGFSTTNKSPKISINQRIFEYLSRRLVITILSGSGNPLPISVTVSYIIFPDNHPTLTITFGQVAGQTGSYQISGPTSFGRNIEYGQFRIANRYLACTGNQCANNCVLTEECLEKGGNVYEGRCVFCAQGIVFEFGTCTRRCGANQLYINRVCRCNNGFVRAPNGRDCISRDAPIPCARNEVRYNGQCRPCPSNSYADQAQTLCVCGAGWTYNPSANSCTQSFNCREGSTWDGTTCRCANGYGRYNGFCIKCPSNAFTSNEQCVCPSGTNYDTKSNQCVSGCQPGSTWNGQSCACNPGFASINGNCVQCPAGSYAQGRTCVCQNGLYKLQQNICVFNCPGSQVWQGGKCVCPNGSIPFNNDCRSCPPNSFPSGNTCVCQNNLQYDPLKNNCIGRCGPSEIWANNGCICISGYARWQGQCRACPKSSAPSTDQQTCVCFNSRNIFIPATNICVDCGANAFPNPAKTACVCSSGYRLQGSICVPNVVCEFNEQLVNGICQCKFGWQRLGPSCVEACGINQYWDGKRCLCNQGHARINGACRPCPTGTVTNPDKTACICRDPNQYFIPNRSLCDVCPANSYPNPSGLDCDCRKGYTKQGNQCVHNCPAEALPNSDGICACINGKVFAGGRCITPVSCPPRSSFNSGSLTCVCDNRNQNIINGVCQSCGQNSVWNKNQCVCATGFFKIAGQCVTCDTKTRYNGTDCVCNLGFFGNRDKCNACHKSCSSCTGPEANQCLTCSDISLVLEKGFCSKNSPCDFGFFLDNKQCTKCLDNCIDCEDIFECKTCSIGYKTKSQNLEGQTIVSCEQICGDGIKFEQQCDDGNNRNGDGCSSTCTEQSDWFCSGGSSSRPSKCEKYTPGEVQIASKGAVNLGGVVLLSVRASYLPPCITKNECSTCFKAIQANVIQAKVPILVTINFVPFSQYQFIIKFDFQGVIVSSSFKVVIKLAEQFKGCIAAQDYDYQLELTIDPAFLAKVDQNETLQIGDIDPKANVKKTSSGAPGEVQIDIPPSALRNLGV